MSATTGTGAAPQRGYRAEDGAVSAPRIRVR